jgi:surface protein
MSFRNVQQNSIENRNTQSIPGTIVSRGAGTGWIRNPSWLTMPATTSANEKVDMLVSIYPESNFIAFIFNTSAGTYTVDWGDGTSSTVTSGVAAQKQYSYSTAALDGTNAPVTFQQSGSTVTRTNHGYPNGYPISFASITTTTGITATQTYYVINATADTFQLAATRGGTALTLTNDGTGIILPYKQAIIQVTPTTGGATFTTVNLQVRNTTLNLLEYAQPIIDLTISAACTSLTITGSTVPSGILEKCTILRHNLTSFASLFGNTSLQWSCKMLQSVSLPLNPQSNTLINTANMFQFCRALQMAPFFNTASVTNMTQMFSNCSSLISVPLYNTVNVTGMNSMFAGCFSLANIPTFNTIRVTDMAGMFANTLITSAPLLNTSNVTSMGSMFAGCMLLPTIPLYDTSKVTDMTAMFSGMGMLASIPPLNTANVTSMVSMFQGSPSLLTIPPLNTSKVTNMQGMFFNCNALQSIPPLDTANNSSLNNTFHTCPALTTIPLLNCQSVQNLSGAFINSYNLQSLPVMNLRSLSAQAGQTFSGAVSLASIQGFNNLVIPMSVAGSKLSGPALDLIYTSLPKVGGAVTFQASPANTVTLVAHGYSEGDAVRFQTITTTTGISINTNYIVRNPTADTFQLSAVSTPTGAILTLTNNGTGTRVAPTITVTSNWGTASDTPAIATAKGWTVTGS